jgi:hypothetical protein
MADATENVNPANRDSFVLSSTTVLHEGILFKKRDHFKGWRPRYFTLDNNFLNYYLDKDDVTARQSIQLCKGTVIEAENSGAGKKVGGTVYFAFLISHPNSSKVCKLSTTLKSDCEEWISALRSTVNNKNAEVGSSPVRTITRLIPQEAPLSNDRAEEKSREAIESDDDDTNEVGTAPINRKLTTKNLPQYILRKIDTAVETLLQGAAVDAEGWVPMFEKPGVTALRKAGTGTICVKGQTVMPYTIPEIYSVVSNGDGRKDLDPQLDIYTRMQWFSHHTGIEHLKFKPVWPTAPRDFCNVTHWRLLADGSLVTLGFSDKFPRLCPEEDGVVRGDLILGGYVFTPVPGGTQVVMLVQVNYLITVYSVSQLLCGVRL